MASASLLQCCDISTIQWNSMCASQKCSARLTRILFTFRIPHDLRCSFRVFLSMFQSNSKLKFENGTINPIILQWSLIAQLFLMKMFLIDLPSVTWILSCFLDFLNCYIFTSFVSGTYGTKLQNFGENWIMTERKKKNFRRFHSKNGIENFSCFSSGVPKKECGVLRNSWTMWAEAF